MIRASLLVVLCSSLAFGQEAPKDAPTNPFPEGRSVILQDGMCTPFGPALVLEETEAKRREWNAQNTAGRLARLEEKRGDAVLSKPLLVAIVLSSMALSAAITAGVYEAATPKPPR